MSDISGLVGIAWAVALYVFQKFGLITDIQMVAFAVLIGCGLIAQAIDNMKRERI